MDNIFNLEEAGRKLGGISVWTLRAWLKQGRLKATKVGGRTMLAEAELERFLRQEQSRVRNKKVPARSGKPKGKQGVAGCSAQG
jgi:excisionase family DNA binding protein